MTLMQIVKSVLDEAYVQIEAEDEAEKDALINARLESIRKEYAALTDLEAPEVDYSDPITRFAYIYKYTVAHADYIKQLIDRHDAISELLKGATPRVACIGGGPGSDLLGILKFMMRHRIRDVKLTCHIFDRERAWADSWSDVATVLDVPFRVSTAFMQLDVTDRNTWKAYGKLAQADLFTLSYFVSEVWRLAEKAEPFFEHFLAQMKSGAVLLFIDNNSDPFVEWFDSMVARYDFDCLEAKTMTMAFTPDEEKDDLGVYLKKFGWILKRSGNVAFRVLRKR